MSQLMKLLTKQVNWIFVKNLKWSAFPVLQIILWVLIISCCCCIKEKDYATMCVCVYVCDTLSAVKMRKQENWTVLTQNCIMIWILKNLWSPKSEFRVGKAFEFVIKYLSTCAICYIFLQIVEINYFSINCII